MSSQEPGSLADQAAAWVPPWARPGDPTQPDATAYPAAGSDVDADGVPESGEPRAIGDDESAAGDGSGVEPDAHHHHGDGDRASVDEPAVGAVDEESTVDVLDQVPAIGAVDEVPAGGSLDEVPAVGVLDEVPAVGSLDEVRADGQSHGEASGVGVDGPSPDDPSGSELAAVDEGPVEAASPDGAAGVAVAGADEVPVDAGAPDEAPDGGVNGAVDEASIDEAPAPMVPEVDGEDVAAQVESTGDEASAISADLDDPAADATATAPAEADDASPREADDALPADASPRGGDDASPGEADDALPAWGDDALPGEVVHSVPDDVSLEGTDDAPSAQRLPGADADRASGGDDAPILDESAATDDAAVLDDTATGQGALPDPQGEPSGADRAPDAPVAVPDENESAPELSEPELRGALEAILLVVDEPTNEIILAQVLEQPTDRISAMLEQLVRDYAESGRGFELRRVAGGWRLYTRPEYASYVEKFVLDGQQLRLTQAALETLAVIAYKQPVTRSRISAIRGVNCDGVVRTLVARALIEECGSEPESGAFLYRTTTLFLEKLGLDGVDELPPLAPFLPDDVDEIADAQR